MSNFRGVDLQGVDLQGVVRADNNGLVTNEVTHQTCSPDLLLTNCYMLNARSLKNKLCDFNDFLLTKKPDILCVTETWLNNSVSNQLLCGFNYNIARYDRPSSEGGGVCIMYNNLTVKAVPVIIPSKYAMCEVAAIDIITAGANVRLITCYRPPSSDTLPAALNQNLNLYGAESLFVKITHLFCVLFITLQKAVQLFTNPVNF
jgi:hypothetical protein